MKKKEKRNGILFWNEEYDLKESDFNYIMTVLKTFIDAPFHKAKQGKYIF